MHQLHWQKSSYSGDGSNCVEIAATPAAVHIRDSKTPTAPHLVFPSTTWSDFIAHVARPAR